MRPGDPGRMDGDTISERREIALGAEAVLLALRAANLVPPGIAGIDFDAGLQQIRVGVGALALRLGPAQLLTPLMVLCRARGIPVPRQAAKRVLVRAGFLVLEIRRERPAAG